MENIIYIDSLTKKYASSEGLNTKFALNGLSLKIKKGKIFGLLGPNGAGKSTLINILAGTVLKTSGEVKIAGVSIDDFPKRARSQIGIVPQEISLDTFFPLYQALEFYAGYYGIKPHLRKTEDILKNLGLWDKRNNFPQQLSGGMKRRFLIAKAMVHSPQILVLDEPTAGVDLELREQLWSYVKTLNAQGTTVIITTHYLAEAQEMCDEIAFIGGGGIIKQSSKADLLHELGERYLDIEFLAPIINTDIDNNKLFNIIEDNKIRFDINGKNADYSAILKQIDKIGVAIKDIKVSEPDLEDIFYRVIKKS